jgi:hypothetical protein
LRARRAALERERARPAARLRSRAPPGGRSSRGDAGARFLVLARPLSACLRLAPAAGAAVAAFLRAARGGLGRQAGWPTGAPSRSGTAPTGGPSLAALRSQQPRAIPVRRAPGTQGGWPSQSLAAPRSSCCSRHPPGAAD